MLVPFIGMGGSYSASSPGSLSTFPMIISPLDQRLEDQIALLFLLFREMHLARLGILVVVDQRGGLVAELLGREVEASGTDNVVAMKSTALARDPVNRTAKEVLHQERRDGALTQSAIGRCPAVLKAGRTGLLAPKAVGKRVVQIQRRLEPGRRAVQRTD